MRHYHEDVEVRRGLVAGQEAPEQFVWRGRLWAVRDVVAHWTETGAWWIEGPARAVLGESVGAATVDGTAVQAWQQSPPQPVTHDLVAEREVWRVEAARGQQWWPSRRGRGADADAGGGSARHEAGYGVFDLAFDWGGGSWVLVSVLD